MISKLYDIKFNDSNIITTVTACAEDVGEWIATTLSIYRCKLCELLVGLDTEWRPPINRGEPQPVAIIQLCVGCRCLIFQLCNADIIPQSLVEFLGSNMFTFVGKEVENDAKKLLKDYGLHVSHTEDVSHMAEAKYHDKNLKSKGLKALVLKFLNVVMEKPKDITISSWDSLDLTDDQIKYACIDAFVSYKLAEKLKKH